MTRDTVQRWVEARQTYETIDYGCRALRARSKLGTWGEELVEQRNYELRCFARQVADACAAAAPILGRDDVVDDGSSAEWWLSVARKRARENLRSAEEAKRQLGGVRQIRLALAA